MKWSDELLTGVEEIDSGNREIVTRVNHALDCVTEYNSAVNELDDTISFLMKYTYGHFADEEKLERENNLENFDEHKLEHDEFAAQIKELYDRYLLQGKSLELAMEANRYMADWYTRHVMTKDLEFCKVLRGESGEKR